MFVCLSCLQLFSALKGYLAGATVDAMVQLRDQFGNNRTSSSPALLFQARSH